MIESDRVTIRDMIIGQGLNIPDDQIYAYPLQEDMEDWCIAMEDIRGPRPDTLGFNSSKSWRYANVAIRFRYDKEHQGDADQDIRSVWSLIQNGKPGDPYEITKVIDSSAQFRESTGDELFHTVMDVELWAIE